MAAVSTDIASVLKQDKSGTEMRRLQRELRDGRNRIEDDPKAVNRDAAMKAYEAGISLLPDIWRLEQRK